MRVSVIPAILATAVVTVACGTNQEQRAATGGLTGVGIGALAGGPIGALIGLGVGAGAGAVTPVGADQVAFWGRDQLRDVAQSTPVVRDMAQEGSGSSSPRQAYAASGSSDPSGAGMQRRASINGSTLRISNETARQVQSALHAEGLYDGPIDGIVGPATERALAAYQKRQGLPETAELHWPTLQSLTASAKDSAAPPQAENPSR